MPRTIRVKLFKFDELSDDAKAKAIDHFRHTNVDYDWWDSVYEDFYLFCQTIGVDVDKSKTYFSGFSSQGDGAGFTADLDFDKMLEGIRTSKFLEHAPLIHEEHKSFSFNPTPAVTSHRVLALIKAGIIELSISAKARDRYPSTELVFDYNYEHGECVNYNRIDQHMGYLEEWLEDVISELSNLLYRMLEKEYEYQTSDEQVQDSIIANEYEFTKDGKQY